MANPISSEDIAEIRALFLRQAAGETAHDILIIDAVLARVPAGQPDPVNFVARAYRFWGREAVLNHFRTIFLGTWRFEPDQDAIRVMPLAPDTAHIYAPVRITVGAAGQQGLSSGVVDREVGQIANEDHAQQGDEGHGRRDDPRASVPHGALSITP